MQHQTVAFDYIFRSLNAYETFENAAPWRGQLRSWECTLAGGRLHATADSFSDTASAEGSLNHVAAGMGMRGLPSASVRSEIRSRLADLRSRSASRIATTWTASSVRATTTIPNPTLASS